MPLPGLARKRRKRLPALTAEAPAWLLLDDEHVAAGYEPGVVAGLTRNFYTPTKYVSNPVLTDSAGEANFVNVVDDGGTLRMWYQVHNSADFTDRWIAYAESADGVTWTKPTLASGTNLCIKTGSFTRGGWVLPIDEIKAHHRLPDIVYRRKYLALCGESGETVTYLSDDGQVWDSRTVMLSGFASDTYITLVEGDGDETWLHYCRPEHLPTTDPDPANQERQVAYMSAGRLYNQWPADLEATVAFSPDSDDSTTWDSTRHYGFTPWRYRGKQWLAFVWIFSNSDPLEPIRAQLVWSYDGTTWVRKSTPRPCEIDVGTYGTDWDGGMVFATARPVTVGDSWYMYYSGWDDGHHTSVRSGGIGLATLRREGWASVEGDGTAPVMRTALIDWPGGALEVNADAAGGQVRVRALDSGGSVLGSRAFTDHAAITTDAVTHTVSWSGGAIPAGTSVYLEFELTSAELYAWRAAE